jgi:hypothetical protein
MDKITYLSAFQDFLLAQINPDYYIVSRFYLCKNFKYLYTGQYQKTLHQEGNRELLTLRSALLRAL